MSDSSSVEISTEIFDSSSGGTQTHSLLGNFRRNIQWSVWKRQINFASIVWTKNSDPRMATINELSQICLSDKRSMRCSRFVLDC